MVSQLNKRLICFSLTALINLPLNAIADHEIPSNDVGVAEKGTESYSAFFDLISKASTSDLDLVHTHASTPTSQDTAEASKSSDEPCSSPNTLKAISGEKADTILQSVSSIAASDSAAMAVIKKSEIMNKFKEACNDANWDDTVNWQKSARTGSSHLVSVSFTCYSDSDPDKGSAYAFLVDPEKQSILQVSQYDFKKERNRKKQIGIVVKEVAAVSASLMGSAIAAANHFPGENDKILHATLSSVVASSLTSVGYHQLRLSRNSSALFGAITSCALGGLVEEIEPRFRHKGTRGDKDMRDLKADIMGCLIGAAGMRIAFEFE